MQSIKLLRKKELDVFYCCNGDVIEAVVIVGINGECSEVS